MVKHSVDSPGIVVVGESKEGKERRLILKPVINDDNKIQVEIIGPNGLRLGYTRVEVAELLRGVEQIPELKRAFVNAVRFTWRS